MISEGILEEVAAPDEIEEETVAEETPLNEEVHQEAEEMPVIETEEEAPEIDKEKVNKHGHADKGKRSSSNSNSFID